MTMSIALDLFPLMAALLAALSCGLLGNFLVLRRLSLMGDAISHSVLPGLVIAFLLTATRQPLVMLAGAAAAGVVTVVLVEMVKRLGRVEAGAAMGVVFSVMFALGVLLIERASVRHVDLDADCVLHGQLETLVWYGAPNTLAGVLSWATLDSVPRQVWMLAGVMLLSVLFVAVLFKELRLAAFDPALATALGFNATLLHYLLMVLVAAATVASFEAVGSILVIAMLICPAATARLMTDRLPSQIACSLVVAATAAVGGYMGATLVPGLVGLESVNAAGSMTVAAGVLLMAAIVASPSHGLVVRWWRHAQRRRAIALDDLLGSLYRQHEAGRTGRVVPSRAARGRALARAQRLGLVTGAAGECRLTERGIERAAEVVRRHRLWEHYLVERAGFAPDHVHDPAERLEHVPVLPREGPEIDPHGRPIPPA